jgi:hypothetical protein
MRNLRLFRAIVSTHSQKSPRYKLTTKELDLLLLAGCSCLLTVLCHPTAEAFQPHSTNSMSSQVPASQVSQTTPRATSQLLLTLPSKRDEIQSEAEDNT